MTDDPSPEMPGSGSPDDPTTPPEAPADVPRAFGEVVSRRPWYLVALVFPFGVLLAVAPFLFPLQRNDLPRVLAAYDSACGTASPTIRCVDRRDFLPRIEPVERPAEASEAFRLILVPRTPAHGAGEGRWLVIRFDQAWQVREDPITP